MLCRYHIQICCEMKIPIDISMGYIFTEISTVPTYNLYVIIDITLLTRYPFNKNSNQ